MIANMTKQPLLSPDESAENELIKAELIAACRTEESVTIVGAGLSSRLGYPSWSKLLEMLHDDVLWSLPDHLTRPFVKPTDWASNPLGYADCIRNHINELADGHDRYYNFLRRTFDSKGTDLLHRQLLDLPFRGIVTTNYDPTLDEALATKDPANAVDNHFVVDGDHAADVGMFLASLSLPNSKRRIAHLHGRFNSPSNIVLTESDYRHRYDHCFDLLQKTRIFEFLREPDHLAALDLIERNLPGWTLHRKFLWTLLSSRRVVFLGFSMTDPYFERMLNTVVKDLWRWNSPTHFAVMGLDAEGLEKEKAKRLRSEHGVAVVFYENLDGRHAGLESLIQEISKACNVIESSDSERRRESPIQLHNTGASNSWMAKINARTRERVGS